MFPQKDFYTDDNRVGGRDSTICCHVAKEWHQGHVISFCIGGRTTLLFFILSTSHNIPSLTPSLLIEIKNTIKHTDSINCLPYLSVSISKFQSTWKIDKSEKLNTWIGRFFILSFWPTGDKTCRKATHPFNADMPIILQSRPPNFSLVSKKTCFTLGTVIHS